MRPPPPAVPSPTSICGPSIAPAPASSVTADRFLNRSFRATSRLALAVPAAAGPEVSFGFVSSWRQSPGPKVFTPPDGARLGDDGCIGVDAHQRTSVPGIYAAGDVVIGLDQISHAMGEGGVAATTIRNDLAKDQPLLR